MMQVSANRVVSIDYTLRNLAGEVVDTSEGRGPLAYLQGHQNIIAGLERALEGKSAGDQVHVQIPPAEAYGEWEESLQHAVPREMFEGAEALEVGMQFQTSSEEGTQIVTVMAVDETSVTVDANHPLAGETLIFDVTILEVREASAEECAHGHVHMEGDHHH